MVNFATSPEMDFGNKVTEAMERGEEWCSFIPRHPVFEFDASMEIDGVPIKAYVDNFCPERIKFREQKTGRTPWTQSKVNKHIQLDMYSTLLEEKFGRVDDECELIWVGARKVRKTVTLPGGIVIEADSTDIELTGDYTIFTRVITAEERKACREMIVRVAKEISEDYRAMKHLYN